MNIMKTQAICFFILLSWVFPVSAQLMCPLPSMGVQARKVHSLDAFKRIPVLANGRIKPLDSYARNILFQFSGRRTCNHEPAISWLSRLLFDPESTREDAVFLINHPQLATALGIEPEKKRLYSLKQIEGAYTKLADLAAAVDKIDEKKRSLVENEIIRVYQNVNLFTLLSRSFLFAFPHPDFTVNTARLKSTLKLDAQQNPFSYYDIALSADQIYRASQNLERIQQDEWTQEDQELVALMVRLYQWSMQYRHLPMTIIPSFEKHDESWMSAWDAMAFVNQNQKALEEVGLIRDMMIAYWNGEQVSFDIAARAFRDDVEGRLTQGRGRLFRNIGTEIWYNKLNLFLWAKIFYASAFLMFLFSLIDEKKWMHSFGNSLIVAGLLPHAAALIMRVMILARPPVSTLYETFLFVALICVLIGTLIERVHRQWLGVVVSSVSGFVFLIIANKFNTDGDSMKMLVAVLNSNFWLSTHVLSITTGYAGTCAAGLVGHIYILQALKHPQDSVQLQRTYHILLGTLGFALTMTFLGTNLGGIWADQSWGRFWGWDPKENGALLIILWTALLFHAKVGRIIGPLGLAVGSALGIIVVIWAWFGVNLLSVGLHSYGFTSGVGYGLIIYLICQLLFLLIAVPYARKRRC